MYLNKLVSNMKVLIKILIVNLMTVTTILYGTQKPVNDTLTVYAYHNKTDYHAELRNDYFR